MRVAPHHRLPRWHYRAIALQREPATGVSHIFYLPTALPGIGCDGADDGTLHNGGRWRWGRRTSTRALHLDSLTNCGCPHVVAWAVRVWNKGGARRRDVDLGIPNDLQMHSATGGNTPSRFLPVGDFLHPTGPAPPPLAIRWIHFEPLYYKGVDVDNQSTTRCAQ